MTPKVRPPLNEGFTRFRKVLIHIIISCRTSSLPEYATLLCLFLLRTALPYIKPLRKTKPEASTEAAADPLAVPTEVLSHLCGLLDSPDTDERVLWLVQDIITEGVVVFFPNAHARKDYLLSMISSVLDENQPKSWWLKFEALCRYFSKSDSKSVLNLPSKPVDVRVCNASPLLSPPLLPLPPPFLSLPISPLLLLLSPSFIVSSTPLHPPPYSLCSSFLILSSFIQPLFIPPPLSLLLLPSFLQPFFNPPPFLFAPPSFLQPSPIFSLLLLHFFNPPPYSLCSSFISSTLPHILFAPPSSSSHRFFNSSLISFPSCFLLPLPPRIIPPFDLFLSTLSSPFTSIPAPPPPPPLIPSFPHPPPISPSSIPPSR